MKCVSRITVYVSRADGWDGGEGVPSARRGASTRDRERRLSLSRISVGPE